MNARQWTSLCVTAMLIAACGQTARATTYYFDANNSTAWDAYTENWADSPTGNYDKVWVDGYDAYFQGTGGNVYLSGSLGVGAITFAPTANTNYVLNNGNLSLNADSLLTVGTTSAGTITGVIKSVITGGYGITKADVGTLILTGANSYTGATTVSAGVLNIQNNTALGTSDGAVSVANGAALQLQGGITVTGKALTIAGQGINYSSAPGALRNISGNNEWAGSVSMNSNQYNRVVSDAGLLTISGDVSLTGSGALNQLILQGNGNILISGAISGGASGFATVTRGSVGTGTVIFTGANTYAGTTTVAGVLQIGNGSTTGTLGAGAVSINSAASLIFNRSNDYTVSNVIYGVGTVTQAGSGSLTLSGSNNFTGGLVISNGTLAVSSAVATTSVQPLGKGKITLNGGTLMYNGTTQATAGHNIVLAGNTTSTVACSTGAAFTTSGGLTGSGNLVVNGVSNSGLILLGGNNTFSGTVTVNSGATFQSNYYSTSGLTQLGNNAAFVVNGGILRAGNSIAGTYAVSIGSLEGTGGYVDSTSSVYTGTTTWNIGGLNKSTGFAGVIRDNTGGGTRVTAITKVGSGTLSLTGSNTYSGGTKISDGTLKISSINSKTAAQPLGKGDVTLDGGSLLFYTNASTTILSNVAATQDFILASGKTSTLNISSEYVGASEGYGGFKTSGSLTGSGNLIVNAAAGVNTGSRVVFSGINDFTGSLTVNNGIVQMNYNAGYSQIGNNVAVIVNGGVLRAASATAGNYTVNVGALSGLAGSYVESTDATTGTTTWSIGELGTDTEFAGTIRNQNTNATNRITALTKVGAGVLTLSGSNTYTGDTTVQNGSLVLGEDSSTLLDINTYGSGVSNQITVANGALLALNGTLAIDLVDAAVGNQWTLVSSAGSVTYGDDFKVTFTFGDADEPSGTKTYDADGTTIPGEWTYTVGSICTATFFQDTGVLSLYSVPEPSAFVIALTGIVSLIAWAWRKHK